MTQRVIAIEEHYSDAQLSSLYDARDAVKSPHVTLRLQDLGELRLKEMDEAGIDVQVLAHASPSTQNLAADICGPVTRGVNNRLAESIRLAPSRFSAFAALPTSDPLAAANELERTVTQLGFCGAMIHGMCNGQWIDDQRFWPIFERAVELDVPIYIHPAFPHAAVHDAYYADYAQTVPMLPRAAMGYTFETANQCVRLVLSDVFDKYPKLKIIIGHLGEAIPFMLGRIDEALSRNRGRDWSFRRYFCENFYVTTSGHFSTPALLCSMMELGTDRILFAVDWPYVSNKEAVDWLTAAPISHADKSRIFSGNAERILRL